MGSAAESNDGNFFSRRMTLLLLAAWLVLVLTAFSRHEMWRDEVEPWAFCLQHDFGDIVSVPALTGHPPLWYYVVEATTWLGSHPHLVRIPHTLFMLLALWLWLRFAPFKKTEKALLIYGYFFLYEYAVLTRNYSLSLLLLFAVAALWRQRHTYFWGMVLLMGLAVFTMILNGLIVGFFILLLWLEAWRSRREKKSSSIKTSRLVMGSLLVMVFFAVAAYWSTPGSGSNFSPALKMKATDIPSAIYALKTAANAFLPVSRLSVQFWNNHIIRFGALLLMTSLVLFFATVWSFKCKPYVLLAYLVSVIAFFIFFFIIFNGSWRHHGYLWILFILGNWIYAEWPSPSSPKPAADSFRRVFFRALCWLQVLAALIPLYYDWRNHFSAGKAVADYLKPRLDGKSLVMCDLDYTGMALAVYLRRPIYFPGLQDTTIWVSYDAPGRDRMAFTKIRDAAYQAMIWNKAVATARDRRRCVWLVLTYRTDRQPTATFAETVVADEKHFVHKIEPDLE